MAVLALMADYWWVLLGEVLWCTPDDPDDDDWFKGDTSNRRDGKSCKTCDDTGKVWRDGRFYICPDCNGI